MLVHEVISTVLMVAKNTDTVRSAMMKIMNRHSGTVHVFEGDNRRIEMVMLRESFPRFKSKCSWRYDDENSFSDPLDDGLGPDDRLSACRATRCNSDRGDEKFNNDQWPEDRITQNR